MTPPTPYAIEHRPEAHCFEVVVDGQRCVADYELDGRIVRMTHTHVPPALEGRGIAGALVDTSLRWIEAQGYKVNPLCSYVRAYLRRHPQWQSLVA